MKRIAILADPLDTQSAGIHVYTRALIRALTTIDRQNEYLIIRACAKNEFPNTEEIVVPIRSFPPLHLRWRQFTSIPSLLRKAKVDLVIEPAHFGPFNLPSTIKRITVIHDLTPILFPAYHGRLSHWMHRFLLPSILRNADHIITNSNCTTKDIARLYPFTNEKMTAIPLGKQLLFQPQNDALILEKYGLQSPYFLFVGTLEPRKNLQTLLKAFEQFKVQNPSLPHQLVLVGQQGWKNNALSEQLLQSPFKKEIVKLGFVPLEDLPALYSQATAFVYPSHYEGFGLPVLEAMACGAVVISSNTSSLPEVGGKAALYFSPEDTEALVILLERVSQESEMVNQLRKRSLQQAGLFSWEKMARTFLEVINTF